MNEAVVGALSICGCILLGVTAGRGSILSLEHSVGSSRLRRLVTPRLTTDTLPGFSDHCVV